MTTIAPAKIKEFTAATLEKIAYDSVKSIPTREPNDRVRLGYNMWIFLKERKGTLAQALKNSGSRILVSDEDAIATITQELKKSGVEI
ncbi:MAG: hypothetical protein PHP42_02015 [Bacteroidota bacterium]|nr:hypothetical protein [Bacteroidota bacterium]